MKKISAFILSSLFALTLSATERQPMVRVNSNNGYEVKIGGTYYKGNHTIPNLSQGTHSVEVYQERKVFLGKRRTLISSSSFQVNNNDVNIFVDNNGQLRINESGGNNNSRRRDRDINDNDPNKRTRDRDIYDDRNDDDADDDDGNWNKKTKKAKKAKHNNGHNNSHNGNGKKKGHYKHHN